MPTTHYEFQLQAIDVDGSSAPRFNNVFAIHSVSDGELDAVKSALHDEVLAFDCYPYQVDARLRTAAEAKLGSVVPSLTFDEILVFGSRPSGSGTTWSPTLDRILHPSEDRDANVCVSVMGTPGHRVWRQLAFEAVQQVP